MFAVGSPARVSSETRLEPSSTRLTLVEDLPLVGAVEVVGEEEASSQEVLAKSFRLLLRESPFTDLHRVQPRPVIDIVTIFSRHGLFC